jgi:uncharacterized protein YlzI (FlbEa/FlbD family)
VHASTFRTGKAFLILGRNLLYAEGVNTIVNLADGKSISVRETCEEVLDRIREIKQ